MPGQTIIAQLCQRGGTAAQWAAENPVLALYEVGYEADTGRRKTGDEVRPWNQLPYDDERLPRPAAGGGSQRGSYLALGTYITQNQLFPLPTGTADVDLHWATGRVLEPSQDYALDAAADPPTVTITALLADFQGERIWGRAYRSSSRTYLRLLGSYGPGYAAPVLPAGTADVSAHWSSGRELEPGTDYTYDAPTRTLTLLADPDLYAGEELWLWLYS